MLHIITRLTDHRNRFVIGQLSHKLKSPNSIIRTDAVFALGKTRLTDALPTVLAALADSNVWVRFEALEAIRNIRQYSIEVISVLLVMLDDDEANVRVNAIRALEAMDTYPDEVIDALLETLKDPDISVRSRAIHALGRLHKPLSHVIDALHRALKDTNLSIRSNAFHALVRISPVNYEVIDRLFAALTREPDWSQRYRRQMLKQIGTPVALAVLSKCEASRRK